MTGIGPLLLGGTTSGSVHSRAGGSSSVKDSAGTSHIIASVSQSSSSDSGGFEFSALDAVSFSASGVVAGSAGVVSSSDTCEGINPVITSGISGPLKTPVLSSAVASTVSTVSTTAISTLISVPSYAITASVSPTTHISTVTSSQASTISDNCSLYSVPLEYSGSFKSVSGSEPIALAPIQSVEGGDTEAVIV